MPGKEVVLRMSLGAGKKEKTLLSVQIASLWFYYFGSAEQII